MLFHGSGSNKKGQEIAVMISRDKGATWTAPIRVAKALPGFISDPEDGAPVRTGDIIPDLAAGPNREVVPGVVEVEVAVPRLRPAVR